MMIESMYPGLFRVEIPLPDSPLKSLNSYVVPGSPRNLVIDTGLNRDECHAVMMSALKSLDIDPGATDFFITHLHADHFGLISRLITKHSRVFFNRPDAEIIESWSGWDPMVAYAGRSGFPEEELRNALENHPGYKFSSEWVPGVSILEDDDVIQVGGYRFLCVETPGHTRGHTCLYEPEKRIFIAGDHILGDITPNIQCWSDEENPLKSYLASLDKVAVLAVDRVLPGHRRVFTDFLGRIQELRQHHRKRLEEVLEILGRGPQHAFQVASRMTWDILCDSWEQFPVAQKWFATGEAIAHLRYLEERGEVARLDGVGPITFSLPG